MMNERIRELEIEAIAYADSKVPWEHRYNDIYYSIVRGKFAELLIQECLLTISKTPNLFTDEEVAVMVKCHNHVEEHFGVK